MQSKMGGNCCQWLLSGKGKALCTFSETLLHDLCLSLPRLFALYPTCISLLTELQRLDPSSSVVRCVPLQGQSQQLKQGLWGFPYTSPFKDALLSLLRQGLAPLLQPTLDVPCEFSPTSLSSSARVGPLVRLCLCQNFGSQS